MRALDLPRRRVGREPRRTSGSSAAPPSRPQYDVFGSERYVLTEDNRALRDAASASAVRLHRDPGQRRDSTAAAASTTVQATVARRHRVRASTSSCTSSGTTSPGLADEYYTLATSRTEPPADAARAVGAERHGAADPAKLKWRDLVAPARRCRRRGTRSVRGDRREDSRPARRRSSARTRPKPRWTRCSGKRMRSTTPLLGGRPDSGKVGAFEGATYEAKGSTGRSGLHHVHARRGGLLRGLPQGHRAGDRPLRGAG